jgi:C4-type Zn-finger protein
MKNSKNKPKTGRGPVIQPKKNMTKKMSCAICMKNRNLRWTWHTYMMPYFSSNYWKCNTCGN